VRTKPPTSDDRHRLANLSIDRSTSRRLAQALAVRPRPAAADGDGNGTKEPGKRPAGRVIGGGQLQLQLAGHVRWQRAAAACCPPRTRTGRRRRGGLGVAAACPCLPLYGVRRLEHAAATGRPGQGRDSRGPGGTLALGWAACVLLEYKGPSL
jgi:hypothetical protein